jgi:hypothetical protein
MRKDAVYVTDKRRPILLMCAAIGATVLLVAASEARAQGTSPVAGQNAGNTRNQAPETAISTAALSRSRPKRATSSPTGPSRARSSARPPQRDVRARQREQRRRRGQRLEPVPDMTPDGRFVAFGSSADNLVGRDTNTQHDIFVRVRPSGTTQRVSVGTAGTDANGESTRPKIADHGLVIAFESSANNVVPEHTHHVTDIFAHDRRLTP